MTDADDWVLLVECYTMVELHTLRATLEARGVPCRLHGEHTHGVLGPIQGAVARSRVLVPRRALAVARALAEDIVGPFDERPELDDEAADLSPFRTAAEDDGEGSDDEELEPADDADPSDPDPPDDEAAPTERPRSYLALGAVLVLMLASVPLAGLAHLYVHKNVRGGILLALSIASVAAGLLGVAWASPLLTVLWGVDLVGGALGISAYNRHLRPLSPAPAPAAALPKA